MTTEPKYMFQSKEVIFLGNYKTRSGYYTIELATMDEFQDLQKSHDLAYKALPEEMKNFINPRTYQERVAALAGGGYVLVVRDGLSEAIIGGALAQRASTEQMLTHQQGAEDVKLYEPPKFFDALTVQNLFLNDSFHGNGICAALFDAAATLALRSDADLVCFGINENNQIAIHSALKAGFSIYGQGLYKKLNVNIWLFQRRVSEGHTLESEAA